jgi:hypothetical protein
VLALAIGGCGSGRSAKPASFDGAAYPPGIVAPGFTLDDQQGRRVSLSTLHGEVVVLAFVSTDCRACRLAAQQIRGALDELAQAPTYGKGAAVGAMSVLFVSTDPASDTHTAVKRFLTEASLANRVLYLTGPMEQERVGSGYHRAPDRPDRRRARRLRPRTVDAGKPGSRHTAVARWSPDTQLIPDNLMDRPPTADGSNHL